MREKDKLIEVGVGGGLSVGKKNLEAVMPQAEKVTIRRNSFFPLAGLVCILCVHGHFRSSQFCVVLSEQL